MASFATADQAQVQATATPTVTPPVCRYFHSSGGCARGAQCRFQHLAVANRSKTSKTTPTISSTTPSTSAPAAALAAASVPQRPKVEVVADGVCVTNASRASRNSPCKFFLSPEGCSRGKKCRFLHVSSSCSSSTPAPTPAPAPYDPTHTSGPGGTSAAPPHLSTRAVQAAMDASQASAPPSAPPHTEQSSSPPDAQSKPKPKSKVQGVCRWYRQGFCARGSECWFKHTLDSDQELRDHLDALHREALESDPDASPRPACSICFEEPETYGLLASCDHVFCLPCLRKWRRPTSAAQDWPFANQLRFKSKSCPLCRTESKFVIPGSFFVKGPAKQRLIHCFRAHASTVPCRYIAGLISPTSARTAGRLTRFCPFGDGCFYSHRVHGETARFHRGARELQVLHPMVNYPVLASSLDLAMDLTSAYTPTTSGGAPRRTPWAGATLPGTSYNLRPFGALDPYTPFGL